MANMGQKDFDARIKRIKNPRNNSYYDPDLQMHIPKRVARSKIEKPPSKSNEALTAFLVSMVLGGVAMFGAQVVRVRYLGLSGGNTAVTFTDILIGFWFVLVLSALMQRRQPIGRLGQIAGLCAMLVAGHNLIWKWPDLMGKIYTPEYVAEVQATTEVGSIVVQGNVFAFMSN
ncbi:hypothetical protein SAMN04488005_1547 [Yoonia tamlensis]|uniref:Uncharacterized protein n=1 Tax=Yoonia tamlensis TaxID=390270 RepID=A0A1I6GF19_9RHOB|nr:hypothetical protein [Yoonia tamlensis]SFR40730.1 hypothetical protein SAMN04488005_1547 [Yoonia tamlensis]